MSERNRKNRINLEAISNIDDEIIESATKERIRLLSVLKKKNVGKRLAVILVAAALLLGAVSATLVALLGGRGNGDLLSTDPPLVTDTPKLDEKSVPVYVGMSASKSNPKITESLSLSLGFKPLKPIKDAVRDDYKGKGGSLTLGDNNELYYGNAKEDIYIAIHIDNPDNYEILSFTFNGEKYSSYMFEAGSDMQTIVIKKNLGDNKGIIEYTIDAIKYVDGTEIKDVKMNGDRTIRVGVHTEEQPAPAMSNETVSYDSISFGVTVSDVNGLIALCGGEVYAALYDGQTIVQKKELKIGEAATVVFDGLMPDTAYQYSVVAVYDSFDGSAINTHVLYEKIVKTEALFELITKPDEFAMNFALRAAEGITVNPIKIELVNSAGEVKEFDAAIRSFRDLSLGEYTMRITYEYQVGSQAKKTAEISHDFSFVPEESQGLNVSDGVVVGIGDCKDSILFINQPVGYAAFNRNADIRAVYIGKNVTSIGFGAFSNCPELKEVIFADESTLEAIGGDAFALCPKLTRITLPDSVKSIGNAVFARSSALAEIKLPDGLESIGDLAFSQCVSLGKLNIPKSVATIGASAFAYCENLELTVDEENENYTLKNGCLVENDTKTLILGFDNAVLPTDDSVTKIGYRAFFGCDGLESISISRHVTEIGTEVFRGCTSLMSLAIDEYNDKYYSVGNCIIEKDTKTLIVGCDSSVIPSNEDIIAIAPYAFYGCVGINSITIPSTVKSIGNSAFSGCSNIGQITLPSALESIGDYAFNYCSNLTLSGAMPNIKTVGQYAFYACKELESISLPDSVTDIGANAFCGSGLKSVTLGTGITKLKEMVFATTPLTSIHIPAKITEINSSFMGCDKLSAVTFADSSQLKTLGSRAFWGCKSLKSITLPENLTSIAYDAFESCGVAEVYNLSGITLNANNSGGLYSTAKVIHTSASTPSKIKQSGDFTVLTGTDSNYLIAYNGSSTTLTLPADIDGKAYEIVDFVFAGNETITSVRFSQNSKLTRIGKSAFEKCSNLKTVADIPEGVTDIDTSAFAYTAIESINLPSSLKMLASAFTNSKLKSLTIPENVTTFVGLWGGMDYLETLVINSSKLYSVQANNCSALKTVTLCDGASYVSITSCSKLEEISLPSTVRNISFRGCESLRAVTFAPGIVSIPNSAFLDCSSIKSVSLPSTVTSIGSSAFSGTSLESIALPAQLQTIGSNAFEGTHITSVSLPDSVGSVYAEAFKDCKELKSIHIGSGLYSISGNAFMGSSAIETVTVHENNSKYCVINGALIDKINKILVLGMGNAIIPIDENLVTSVGEYAFYGRYTRSSITIPENVTDIGAYAFANSTKLASVVIPAGITRIEEGTFENCKSLTSVTLPNGIVYIGSRAFYDNVKLRSIILPQLLTCIDGEAFYGCEILADITFLGTSEQWKNNVQKGVYWDRYVPAIFIECSDKEV